MSMYTKFTYGAEIEWSDVDRTTPIPEHCGVWDKDETTIMNSNGMAIDATGKRDTIGGEINTRPTDTIDEQVEIFDTLREQLNPVVLHRNSTHVHIGVPGLVEDVDTLKHVFQYVQDNQDFVYFEMLAREVPTAEEFPDPEDLKLAKNFNRQRKYWSKAKVPPNRAANVLQATTPKEFYDRHFQWNEERQRYLYSIGIVRAGINVRSLFKYGTIEFRVFPGTTSSQEFRSCLEFSDQFVQAALHDHSRTAQEIYESREWNFPVWPKFQPDLDRIFLATKQGHMEYPDPNIAYQRRREQERLEREQKKL